MQNNEEFSHELAEQLLASIKFNTQFSLDLSGKYIVNLSELDEVAKKFVGNVIKISASYDTRKPMHTKSGVDKIQCYYCQGSGELSTGR